MSWLFGLPIDLPALVLARSGPWQIWCEGKFADEALDVLRYQPQRGARMLEKVLKSALGNAQDPDQNAGRTVKVEHLVGDGGTCRQRADV